MSIELLLLSANDLKLVVGPLAGFSFFLTGFYLSRKDTKSQSSIEINFFVGSFKINSPNAGLIMCFLGFVLIILSLVI